jgi:hypothetical protein
MNAITSLADEQFGIPASIVPYTNVVSITPIYDGAEVPAVVSYNFRDNLGNIYRCSTAEGDAFLTYLTPAL